MRPLVVLAVAVLVAAAFVVGYLVWFAHALAAHPG